MRALVQYHAGREQDDELFDRDARRLACAVKGSEIAVVMRAGEAEARQPAIPEARKAALSSRLSAIRDVAQGPDDCTIELDRKEQLATGESVNFTIKSTRCGRPETLLDVQRKVRTTNTSVISVRMRSATKGTVTARSIGTAEIEVTLTEGGIVRTQPVVVGTGTSTVVTVRALATEDWKGFEGFRPSIGLTRYEPDGYVRVDRITRDDRETNTVALKGVKSGTSLVTLTDGKVTRAIRVEVTPPSATKPMMGLGLTAGLGTMALINNGKGNDKNQEASDGASTLPDDELDALNSEADDYYDKATLFTVAAVTVGVVDALLWRRHLRAGGSFGPFGGTAKPAAAAPSSTKQRLELQFGATLRF